MMRYYILSSDVFLPSFFVVGLDGIVGGDAVEEELLNPGGRAGMEGGV